MNSLTKLLMLALLVPLSACAADDGSDSAGASASSLELPSSLQKATKLIALGGSITAGLGVGTQYANAHTGCEASTESYPYLMAHDLKFELVQTACSGATAANILPSSDPEFVAQPAANGKHWPSQLDTVGYGAGVANAIEGNVVVLFVGGNDTEYIRDVGWCFQHVDAQPEAGMPSPPTNPSQLAAYLNSNWPLGCPHDDYHTADFQARAASLQKYVAKLVQYVEDKHPAMVVVNTYYSVAKTEDEVACVPDHLADVPLHQPSVSPGLDWLNARLIDLDQAIDAGALAGGYKNVRVVKPDFAGHAICSATPWVAGLGTHDGANAHPTVAGQHELATLDENALLH